MRRSRRNLKYVACVLVVAGLTALAVWTGSRLRAPVLTDRYRTYRRAKGLIASRTNNTTHRKHDVILSAYMNSGSRFTGRLLGFNSHTFFFYEPLWKFSIWNYFQPPDVSCSSTDGGCRVVTLDDVNAFRPDRYLNSTEPIVQNIPGGTAPTDLLLHVLSRVYTCTFLPLRHVIQDRVQDKPEYSGPSWEPYRQCIARFRARSQCLRELETECHEKSHRLMKVLRMALGSFRPLLETNPRLKIVHLVRDPRAIVNSRYFSRNYPVYGYQESNIMERNLCDKMAADYTDGLRLMADFPGRVKFLFYEDLLANFDTRVTQVFRFLNMRYNKTEIRKLAEVVVNLSPPEKGSDFVHDRKKNNAIWWRLHMQLFQIQRVDAACLGVYKQYGYKHIREEAVLRNVSYSTWSIPEHLVF